MPKQRFRRKKSYKPGDRVPVVINGERFDTFIDKNGTQRFPMLKVMDWLTGFIQFQGVQQHPSYAMNDLAILAATKQIPQDERRFVYRHIGMSVCGYAEVFGNDDIKNPCWDN